MDLDALTKKLSSISEKKEKTDETYRMLVDKIAMSDDTNRAYEYFPEEDKHYLVINNMYKKYISQYSKEYIEMSEYYYGDELPYEVYCKEFKKDRKGATYLDTPKDVKELYGLFMFYGMLSQFIPF
tara:strand:- start:175 stop:552 length:378 start_codon:yes stop_codon:yes gene_type:complete